MAWHIRLASSSQLHRAGRMPRNDLKWSITTPQLACIQIRCVTATLQGPPSVSTRQETARNILTIMSGQSLMDKDLVSLLYFRIVLQVNIPSVELVSHFTFLKVLRPASGAPGSPTEEQHARSPSSKGGLKDMGPACCKREAIRPWCHTESAG